MAVCQVLIVDDDQWTRQAMGEILTRAGYKVTLLASGDGLEEQMDRHDFAAAIIDYNLPQRNGLEIAQSLRQKLPACRIILISSEYQPQRQPVPEAGLVDHFLAKPFSKHALLSTLTALCRPGEKKPA